MSGSHTVGVSGESFLLTTNGSNLGSMFVVLEPFDQRTVARPSTTRRSPARSSSSATKRSRAPWSAYFGRRRSSGLGNAGGFKLQTEQRGYVDLDGVANDDRPTGRQGQRRPAVSPACFTIYRAYTPQSIVDIDRTKVQSLQVPMQDVFTTLQVYMGGLYVNQFNKFGRTWQVNVQADAALPHQCRHAQATLRAPQRGPGQMVPLGTVARVEPRPGPLSVMRYNMYASAAVNGTPAPGVSSGDGRRRR